MSPPTVCLSAFITCQNWVKDFKKRSRKSNCIEKHKYKSIWQCTDQRQEKAYTIAVTTCSTCFPKAITGIVSEFPYVYITLHTSSDNPFSSIFQPMPKIHVFFDNFWLRTRKARDTRAMFRNKSDSVKSTAPVKFKSLLKCSTQAFRRMNSSHKIFRMSSPRRVLPTAFVRPLPPSRTRIAQRSA